MIIATAGHIDHGKTTLVRSLTGIDTDQLPEEKARGISIDTGFAHWTLDDGATIGFVDVPGHERFVRNMLSGVYAVDHVLLVIAADDSVMPQTREHLQIISLLGVTQATVVITKADRVEAARLGEVEAEAKVLLRGAGYGDDVALIAVSAVTGQGMDALRGRLVAAATRARDADHSSALPRFVVDRVFTAAGSGTIVRGTVISGSIAAGDTLVITPAGTPARVRKLQRHGKAVDRANAGERCAINLANVEQTAVVRGDWLVAAAAHQPTDRLDVHVRVLASEKQPLKHWTPVHLHIGAADIVARVALRRGASVPPGEQANVQLRLKRPIHAANGDRFILRDNSASRTIGGGAVIDPFPPTRRRDPRVAALEGRNPEAALQTLLATSAEGVELEWLARVFNMPLSAVSAMVPTEAVIVQAKSHIAFSAERVAQLQAQTVARVQKFHAQNRGATGLELGQLHGEIARTLPSEVFTALAKLIASRAGLVMQGSQLRAASHDATDNPRDAEAWQKVRPRLQDAAFAIPSVRELADATGVPLQPLRDLMHRKSAKGELVKITLERFALPDTMEMLRQKVGETAAAFPEGLFTAAQYRDVIGTGRGLAIEILECFDKQGVTLRRGNLRALRKSKP